jgi:RNA polymerase sigma-70 factor (ECF subfamily)
VSNPEQEQAWLKQALAGDQSAFGKLAEAYQVPVYNLAYRMLGNAGEAEEAAQETFLKAYTHLRTYDRARKFSTWLLSIASHHCIDRLRRRRFTWLSIDDNPMLSWLTADQGKPEESAMRAEVGDEVRDLLSHLEPPYRLPLILRYWHDLSYEEIAETLGITEAAVKSRLHRARHQMADAMAQRDAVRVAQSPSLPGIMQVL